MTDVAVITSKLRDELAGGQDVYILLLYDNILAQINKGRHLSDVRSFEDYCKEIQVPVERIVCLYDGLLDWRMMVNDGIISFVGGARH